MDTTFHQTPAELIFPPQAAFSWTLRWARTRREEAARARGRIGERARTGVESADAARLRAHDPQSPDGHR